MLVYLFFLVALGLPIMVMEFAVGRASRQNVGRAFKTLEPAGTKWHWYGHVAIGGNYILMMFYAVISGFCTIVLPALPASSRAWTRREWPASLVP